MKATGPKLSSNEILNWLSDGCSEKYNAESIPSRKLAMGRTFPSSVFGKMTLTSPAVSAAPKAT